MPITARPTVDSLRLLADEERFTAICEQIYSDLRCPPDYLTINRTMYFKEVRYDKPLVTIRIGNPRAITLYTLFTFTLERPYYRYTADNGEVVCGKSMAQYCIKLCRKKIELRAANERLAELEAEVAALRAENAELRLLPDAPEYLAAKKRFDAAKEE